jgi:AraC family transcriptional regulator of adaptative response / DNA-3-methyladenine glycosylase II
VENLAGSAWNQAQGRSSLCLRAMPSSQVETLLPYSPPLDWPSLLGFLSLRATPGVEAVADGVYRRTIVFGGRPEILEVGLATHADGLIVRAPSGDDGFQEYLRYRVERVFDLTASPSLNSSHLCRDPALAPVAAKFPGIRVPGSWDGFETAVRAILGQRISVKAATSLAGRLAARHGVELQDSGGSGLTRLFPTPERLADADLGGLGLTGQKERSIASLARAVADGSLSLDGQGDPGDTAARLLELPGIGPWTVQYVAMRALRDPDAFPAGDLILRRAAAPRPGATLSESQLVAMAEGWRPWRAYAAMLLWASYSSSRSEQDGLAPPDPTGAT